MNWQQQKAREAESVRQSRLAWFATIDGRTITEAAADVGMCQNSLGRLIQRAGYEWRRHPVGVVRKMRVAA